MLASPEAYGIVIARSFVLVRELGALNIAWVLFAVAAAVCAVLFVLLFACCSSLGVRLVVGWDS